MVRARNIAESRDFGEPVWEALQQARQYDQTLKGVRDRSLWPGMMSRYVAPVSYTREARFSQMLAGEPIVVEGFPIPSRGPIRHLPAADAGEAIIDWMMASKEEGKHRVYSGPAGTRREDALPEIARHWRANRTPFGVTDLHIRGTGIEEVIAPEGLERLQSAPRLEPRAGAQEMFSFVISSRAIFRILIRMRLTAAISVCRPEAVAGLGYL